MKMELPAGFTEPKELVGAGAAFAPKMLGTFGCCCCCCCWMFPPKLKAFAASAGFSPSLEKIPGCVFVVVTAVCIEFDC